jgi:hypothetical protein
MLKLIIIILCLVEFTGCAVLPDEVDFMPRMKYADLQHYKIDCSIKDQQRKFLVGQATDHGDKLIAGFARLTGDPDAYKVWDGSFNSEVRGHLHQQQEMCH